MRRILSTLLFLLGIFLLTNSQNNITGSFIGNYLTVTSSYSLGFFFIFISSIIFLTGLEEKVTKYDPKIKTYRRKLEKLEHHKISYNEAKEAYNIKSIRGAILNKKKNKVRVPLKEALKIYKECNKKINSGEWVELGIIGVGSTKNPKKFPHSTTIYRYWGPPEYLQKTSSALKRLYKKGKIGKTHELVREEVKIGNLEEP
jgi:hypothetical protein